MDDSGSPSIDLDLNPDMMTTQTGTPTVISSKPVLPARNDLIDITPGATTQTPPTMSSPQHVDLAPLPTNKVVDITPDGSWSENLPSSDNSQIDAPKKLDDAPVLTHLVDIVPQEEVVPAPPVPQNTSPVALETSQPPEETIIVQQSTLYEDPDLVKLIK